jgi:superfamily II DNA helicase RecQ
MCHNCLWLLTFNRGKQFREDFSRLYELRNIIDCPMGLFTATLSEDMVDTLITSTGLMKNNFEIVADSPDRSYTFHSNQTFILMFKINNFLI